MSHPADIACVTANNSGPMTFRGTNSYVFGNDATCCILDPGPDDPAHLEALVPAVAGRAVEAILLTHRHDDHSGLVARATSRFGAPLWAASAPDGPDADPSRNGLPRPDRILNDGDRFGLAGHRVEVVATPGHTSDHLAFALPDRDILFSGDHVMGWSTTVVIPPDGSMRAYRRSLRTCLARAETLYLPGHGEAIERPDRLVRSLLVHRTQREEMIVACLREKPCGMDDLVARLYPRLEPGLRRAAAHSVRAHLVELAERGVVSEPSPLGSDGPFRIAE